MAMTPDRNNNVELAEPPFSVKARRLEMRRAVQENGGPLLAFCDTDGPNERARVSRISRLAALLGDDEELYGMAHGEVAHGEVAHGEVAHNGP